MVRRFLTLSLLALTLAACGDSDQSAMHVAEKGYQALIKGDYADYVDLEAGIDSLSEAARRERIDMVNEYMAIEQRLRGGMVSAKALRDTIVEDSLCYVFLQLQWADSTSEEVMVPMVHRGGRWLIR